MRILVMESINALPDRVLLVQEARRRALTEPAASTFSLTKRRCCSWHDGVIVALRWRPTSTFIFAIRKARGSAGRTRTPMAC
jgi:hypothetical protein